MWGRRERGLWIEVFIGFDAFAQANLPQGGLIVLLKQASMSFMMLYCD
jgi:hypothetical protein